MAPYFILPVPKSIETKDRPKNRIWLIRKKQLELISNIVR
jgi:hypothetical protein